MVNIKAYSDTKIVEEISLSIEEFYDGDIAMIDDSDYILSKRITKVVGEIDAYGNKTRFVNGYDENGKLILSQNFDDKSNMLDEMKNVYGNGDISCSSFRILKDEQYQFEWAFTHDEKLEIRDISLNVTITRAETGEVLCDKPKYNVNKNNGYTCISGELNNNNIKSIVEVNVELNTNKKNFVFTQSTSEPM